MLVSEFAKKFVKVSLSADGGDETFYGYEKYSLSEERHKIISTYRKLIKPIAYLGEPRLHHIGQRLGVADKIVKAVAVATETNNLLNTFLISSEIFSQSELKRIFGSEDRGARLDKSFGCDHWQLSLIHI